MRAWFGIALCAYVIVGTPAVARQLNVEQPLATPDGEPLHVIGVDLDFTASFAESRAKSDAKAAGKRTAANLPPLDPNGYPQAMAGKDTYSTLPFKQMFPLVLRDTVHDWQLSQGRPVRLKVSFEELHTADLVMAWLAYSSDELKGRVDVIDASSGALIGRATIDVVNGHSGLAGMAIRGSGVREALAEEFSLELSRFVSGRKHRQETAGLR